MCKKLFDFCNIMFIFAIELYKKRLQMITNMQKIDERKIVKYGSIAHTLPLPKVFITDNNLQNGEVEIFRDKINGKDALIIIPKQVDQISSEKLIPQKEIA